MFSRTARAAFAATLAAAMLGLPGPAPADPGGAQVLNFKQCFPFGDDITFCNAGHVVNNTTHTPSGNVSITGQLQSRLTFTGPGCDTSNTLKQDFHELLTGGPDPQTNSFQRREKFTVDCPAIFTVRQQCEIVDHFHFANEQVQFDRSELNCTPLP